MEEYQHHFRTIPAMDKLLKIVLAQPDIAETPRAIVVQSLRRATEDIRVCLLNNAKAEVSVGKIVARFRDILDFTMKPSLHRVINATGVVLHTNLGRAPLSARAKERVLDIADGYSTLEYDVTSGERGSRYSHIAGKLCSLLEAEDALVVNNNAAAVLLVLSCLAKGQEVIVSRGQLVEIGGSFRVPEVISQGGAILVEVGTTNKTHISDYERAIGPNTAAILKVHTSNYRIVGFTSQPDDKALVDLAHRWNVPVIEDLGSGTVIPIGSHGQSEPTIGERLRAGIDVVTFSGDKLFGGAQAGFIAGKKLYIERMKKHPLLRAVRIDKLSLAALEGTILDYLAGAPEEDIPVLQMLQASRNALEKRARDLNNSLAMLGAACSSKIVQLSSQAGGGSLPAADLASYGVSLRVQGMSTAALERSLRQRPVPVIARVQDDSIVFDVRCLNDQDLPEISRACNDIITERLKDEGP